MRLPKLRSKSLVLLTVTLCLIGITIMVLKFYTPPPPKEPTPVPRDSSLIIKGSIPYWDQNRAVESFMNHTQSLNYINVFWYYLTDDGAVKKYTDAHEDVSLINYAHATNVKVFAVLTNLPEEKSTTWDSERVEKVIKNEPLRRKHVTDIVRKMDERKFDGILIDYEQVKASQKDNFSAFIHMLSDEMHERNKLVAVALHPKRINVSNLGGFQDWEELAKYADHLNIMAYEEHWDSSSAGPVASIGWIKEIIVYLQSLDAPSDKFYLGVPLDGYDWNKDDNKKADGVTHADIQEIVQKYDAKEMWDDPYKSPYLFYYDDNADKHEVWYENAQSVKEKINLAEQTDLGGISFWRLGGEDPNIWNTTNNPINK